MDPTSEPLLPPPVGQDVPHRHHPTFAFLPTIFQGSFRGQQYRDYVPLATVDQSPNHNEFIDPQFHAGFGPGAPPPAPTYDRANFHPDTENAHERQSTKTTTKLCPFRLPDGIPWKTALIALLWYTRMCLVLVLLSATVIVPCSLVGAFFGALALSAFAPWSSLDFGTVITACMAGAAVLGCVLGLGGFGVLVVRRVRAGQVVPVPAPDRSFGLEPVREARWYDNTNFAGEREPLELSWVLSAGVVASVGAMAVGVAVVPGLTTGEVLVGHALAMGVVGAVVPLSPFLFSALLCSLLEGDAEAGLKCCGDLCFSCCSKK